MSICELTSKSWDLIVVGGGVTGAAAAVSAKRLGMQVLILEKSGSLGGAAAVNLINPFMEYYTTSNGKKQLLSQGFFTELRGLIRELDGAEPFDSSILHEEYIKIALDRLVMREDVSVHFHAVLCGVSKEGERISDVSVATKAGIQTFRADVFIDCTGDGDLAALTGCPFRLGREDGLCQPMTLCFRIGNVDIPKYRDNYDLMQRLYKQFRAEGKINNALALSVEYDNRIYLQEAEEWRIQYTDM